MSLFCLRRYLPCTSTFFCFVFFFNIIFYISMSSIYKLARRALSIPIYGRPLAVAPHTSTRMWHRIILYVMYMFFPFDVYIWLVVLRRVSYVPSSVYYCIYAIVDLAFRFECALNEIKLLFNVSPSLPLSLCFFSYLVFLRRIFLSFWCAAFVWRIVEKSMGKKQISTANASKQQMVTPNCG